MNLTKKEISDIKNSIQTQVISTEDKNINDQVTIDDLTFEITDKTYFDNFEDIFKIYPLELFGNYKSINDLKENLNLNSSKLYVYRINKKTESLLNILDDKLKDLINLDSLKSNKLGRSVCNTLVVELKDKTKAILKIQSLPSIVTIEDEYKNMLYLQNKLNVPKIYYYNEVNNTKYLLREDLSGEPLFKYNNFGKKLGLELKHIHSLYDSNCQIDIFKTKKLVKRVEDNLEIVTNQYNKKHETNYTQEEILDFVKANKPEDDSFIHGDFSLPNILVNNDSYYYIDLGTCSISTKYFDFYYLKRSLEMNHKETEWNNILESYEITIDENKMKWMDIIDKSFF